MVLKLSEVKEDMTLRDFACLIKKLRGKKYYVGQ